MEPKAFYYDTENAFLKKKKNTLLLLAVKVAANSFIGTIDTR